MQLVKTKTQDGLIFTGLISQPPQKSDTIIVHVHGMSGDIYINSWYSQMHKKYSENNIAFLVGENRGTHSITQFENTRGDLVNIGNTFELLEDCVYDIQAWVDYATELGYKNIWLQGHSLGTSKIAYYLYSKNPKNISGVILLSPSDMVGCFMGKVEKQPVVIKAEELLKQGKYRELLEDEIFEGNILSAKTIVNFFGENTNLAIFNFAKPNLGFKVVNSISVPVLAITGNKDEGIVSVSDPYKAMEKLEEELINAPRKKTIVYEGASHQFEGFEERIVKDVLEFILK